LTTSHRTADRVAAQPLIGHRLDEAAVADRAARSYDRDHDRLGMARQAVAVLASGDRTERLRLLRVPTLVLHGADDAMCDVSSGRATAAAIPGAKLVIIHRWATTFPNNSGPSWPPTSPNSSTTPKRSRPPPDQTAAATTTTPHADDLTSA
jgi:pimeloyl-ACP methyl ester carboxylesterase